MQRRIVIDHPLIARVVARQDSVYAGRTFNELALFGSRSEMGENGIFLRCRK